MAISVNEVEKGYLYKAKDDQDRVVLGCDAKGNVVYAYRGGRVLNPYKDRQSSKITTFAAACTEKSRKIDDDLFNEIIESVNASAVLVQNDDCFGNA